METLPAPLVWSALIYGSFTGSLKDPVFIAMLVIAAALGASRVRWWGAGLFALAAALTRFLIGWNNRAAAGLELSSFMIYSAVMTILAVMLIWFIVSRTARLFRRATP